MEQVKCFLEHLIVDVQQITEHLIGLDEVTHNTKPCLICQPMKLSLKPKISTSVLPTTFPSDLAYEMLKLNPAEQLNLKIKKDQARRKWRHGSSSGGGGYDIQTDIDTQHVEFSGKQLVLFSDSDIQGVKRPSYIKEMTLFLHSLGYELQDAFIIFRNLQQMLHAKQYEAHNSTTPSEQSIYMKKFKKQKFVFLCWNDYSKQNLEKLMMLCEPFASQMVCLNIVCSEQKKQLPVYRTFYVTTPSAITLNFPNSIIFRKFHFMMLQREGRLSVSDVCEFTKQEHNYDYPEITFHTQQTKERERKMKLSFLY